MADAQGANQRMFSDSEDTPPTTQQQQSEEKPRQKKAKNILYKLGITEVVFGSISILLAIVTLILAATNQTYIHSWHSDWENITYHEVIRYNLIMTYPAQGIWCGAVLIVTGIFGIKTKSNPSRCMFNANMALSIITAFFMLAFLTMSGIAAGTSGSGENRIISLTALHAVLGILSLSSGIMCILHCGYCCAVRWPIFCTFGL